MKRKYKITYLPLFYKDLDNITDYIRYHLGNEIAANNFINELEKQIVRRSFSPDSYEEYILIKKSKNKYYRIYVKNYIVFYTVKNETMEVRRILYSRRNFDKLI